MDRYTDRGMYIPIGNMYSVFVYQYIKNLNVKKTIFKINSFHFNMCSLNFDVVQLFSVK